MRPTFYSAAERSAFVWSDDLELLRALIGAVDDHDAEMLLLLRGADEADRIDREHLDRACLVLGRAILGAVTEWIDDESELIVARNFAKSRGDV